MDAGSFARQLIAWQKSHGRHDLPWQGRGAYAAWISEVMLQQTQVATVIPYYQRFMTRFPDVGALAAAAPDEVMGLWSGLGYYSRARNLQRAARIIAEQHEGVFPQDYAGILALPGIGRSTAGAICALAFEQPRAILDGNAKRVFARHFAISGWPGAPDVERALWQRAEAELPGEHAAAYTQALMDLGATVCLRSRPRCAACPVAASCAALGQGRVAELPAPRPARALPQKTVTWLVCRHGRKVLLERRPPSGLWGGLWGLPESTAAPQQAALALLGRLPGQMRELAPLTHGFTHFRLKAIPVELDYPQRPAPLGEARWLWLDLADLARAPLPKPVRALLAGLA